MSGYQYVDTDARTEDLRWMIATGENLTGAAQRLGTTPAALDKWCRRYGLAAEIEALRSREPYDNEHISRDQSVAAARRRWDRQVAS
jgi:hypothetical protein